MLWEKIKFCREHLFCVNFALCSGTEVSVFFPPPLTEGGIELGFPTSHELFKYCAKSYKVGIGTISSSCFVCSKTGAKLMFTHSIGHLSPPDFRWLVPVHGSLAETSACL